MHAKGCRNALSTGYVISEWPARAYHCLLSFTNWKPGIFMKENWEEDNVLPHDRLHTHRKSDNDHDLICSWKYSCAHQSDEAILPIQLRKELFLQWSLTKDLILHCQPVNLLIPVLPIISGMNKHKADSLWAMPKQKT